VSAGPFWFNLKTYAKQVNEISEAEGGDGRNSSSQSIAEVATCNQMSSLLLNMNTNERGNET